jgi:hypothetical protein
MHMHTHTHMHMHMHMHTHTHTHTHTHMHMHMHMRGGMVHTRPCPTYTHPAAWGEGPQRRRAGITMGARPRIDARVW